MKRTITVLVTVGILIPLANCSDSPANPGPVSAPDAAREDAAQVDPPKPDAMVATDSAAPALDSTVDSGSLDSSPDGGVAPATLNGALAKGIREKGLSNKNVSADSEVVFVGTNLSFTIPLGAVVDKVTQPFTLDTDGDGVLDASVVSGMVDLTVLEMSNAIDMFRRGRPTVTNAGEWLESGGAFEASAAQNGRPLTILKFKTVEFKPSTRLAAQNQDPMQWFLATPKVIGGTTPDPSFKLPVAGPLGRCSTADLCARDKACWDQAGCKPFLCTGVEPCRFDVCVGVAAACPAKPECAAPNACADIQACKGTADCRIKCKGKCDTDECKSYQPTCAPFPNVATNTANGNYLFNGSPFGNIGPHEAANCDRITHLASQHATTLVRFTANYSVESGVFFIPSGENSAIKLYTRIAGAPPGQEGFQSYANSMPVGIAGKLVIVAVNNGKYYYQEKPYTIANTGNPAAGQDTVLVAPQEVSEAAFNAAIDAL
jgi:hypothetical protein